MASPGGSARAIGSTMNKSSTTHDDVAQLGELQ